jgi:hypothetical protein
MQEVNCGKTVGKEAYPVTITIKKKFNILPPLEQTNTKFLVEVRNIKNITPSIRCHLINSAKGTLVHEGAITKGKEIGIKIESAGYYKWRCGLKVIGDSSDDGGSSVTLTDIVGYKSFRVYSTYEVITLIGAIAAIIAAITGIFALVT